MLTLLLVSILGFVALRQLGHRFHRAARPHAALIVDRAAVAMAILLPVTALVGLRFAAPGYLSSLAVGNAGLWTLAGALSVQILMNLGIKKIVELKV